MQFSLRSLLELPLLKSAYSQSLSPIGAAIYAGTSTFTALSTKFIIDDIGGKSSRIVDITTWAISIMSGIFAGAMTSSLAGHSISLINGAAISGALVLTASSTLVFSLASLGIILVGVVGAIMIIAEKNSSHPIEEKPHENRRQHPALI